MFVPLQGLGEGIMAPRGHKAAGVIRGTTGMLAYIAGDLIGTALAGPLAGMALGLAADASISGEAIQTFIDLNRRMKHVNMGGNYEDTRISYTMRQRAAQELGSSVTNARQWLGKEAIFLHQ